MNVQNHIAVVGDDPIAPNRPAAKRDELAGDIGAGHRDDFDRQRKASKNLYELAVIDDADETLGSGGHDLLAGQGGAAALDQCAVPGRFVGAVDVQRQIARGVEIEFGNPRGRQALRGRPRARNGALKLYFTVLQRFDECIDGGPGTDPEQHPGLHVL